MLRVSFWGRVEVVAVVTVMVGGRSRGAGTGGTAAAAGGGLISGIAAGEALDPWARPPARMLQRLSEELLRPDWLLASLPLSCWSRYVSWADSVLLCAVTEMRGLDVPRGGTGGGAFLLLTAVGNRGEKKKKQRKTEVSIRNQLAWRGLCVYVDVVPKPYNKTHTWTLPFLSLSDCAESNLCISCLPSAPLTSFCLQGSSSWWHTYSHVPQGTDSQRKPQDLSTSTTWYLLLFSFSLVKSIAPFCTGFLSVSQQLVFPHQNTVFTKGIVTDWANRLAVFHFFGLFPYILGPPW